jgi:hypothetical protein
VNSVNAPDKHPKATVDHQHGAGDAPPSISPTNSEIQNPNASSDYSLAGKEKEPPQRTTTDLIIARWTRVLGVSTILLFLATLGTGYVLHNTDVSIGKQLGVMQGQLDEMKSPSAERPFLFVLHDDSQSPAPQGEALFPGKIFGATFKNYGKTPAIYRGFQPRCGYFATNPPNFQFTDDKWAASVLIGVGEPIGPLDCPFVATADQIGLAQAGKGYLFLASRILYDDLGGKPHETIFCMIYKPDSKRFGLLPNDEICNRYK